MPGGNLTFWGTIIRHGTTTLPAGIIPDVLMSATTSDSFTVTPPLCGSRYPGRSCRLRQCNNASVITPARVLAMSTHVGQQPISLKD